MRVGVIGLGNIGGAVAANLLADGHELCVHDLDEARAAPLREAGAAVGAPAAVGAHAEITFASLPAPEVVREVARAWLPASAAGDVFVDLSTSAPSAVVELGAELAAAGRHLLECPLTGGAPGAKARALVFLAGGDEGVFERCRPLLESLGRASFHLGPLGRGNVAKLVNSLLAFTSTWVSLEGLAIAARAGIEARTMVEVVRTGGAGNFYMDRMVEGLNRRGGTAHFALGLAAKDARLIVDHALRLGVPAPVAGQIAQVFTAAAGSGLAERDWSDVADYVEQLAGVKLELAPPARR